jgi:hypothetical protein
MMRPYRRLTGWGGAWLGRPKGPIAARLSVSSCAVQALGPLQGSLAAVYAFSHMSDRAEEVSTARPNVPNATARTLSGYRAPRAIHCVALCQARLEVRPWIWELCHTSKRGMGFVLRP